MSAQETWLPVTGYEGLYEVSDQGRVRSVDRIVTDRGTGRKRRYRGRVLRPTVSSSGYKHVIFSRQGAAETMRIHQMVCAAFYGEAPEGCEVLHEDGDKLNNVASNLRWGTRTENIYDAVRHGSHFQAKKTHCPRGHILEAPNLSKGMAKRGFRRCLACHRGAAYIQNRPELADQLKKIADQYYSTILATEGA